MPVIDKKGPQGNAYYILGVTKRILEQTGREEEWPAVEERMTSGDYDNLCAVAEEVTHGSVSFVER